MLAATETVSRRNRATLQEQRDRQNTGEGQADIAAAGEVASTGRGWKRKVNIPQTDENHTQSEVWAGISAGISACHIPEHCEGYTSVSGRKRQARNSVGESEKLGRWAAGTAFQQHSVVG